MRGIKWLVVIAALTSVGLIAFTLDTGASAAPGYPAAGEEHHQDELCFSDLVLDLASPFGTPEFSAGLVCFNGPSTVQRGDPFISAGFETVQTEMVSMELSGIVLTLPFTITAGVGQGLSNPTFGAIKEQTATTQFPADSFFDVFLEVDTGVAFGTLHNCAGQPVHQTSVVNNIPTIGEVYTSPDIPLCDTGGLERIRGINPVTTVSQGLVGGIVSQFAGTDSTAQDSGSQADNYTAAIAAGVVGSVVALAVGGWYARRRWLR